MRDHVLIGHEGIPNGRTRSEWTSAPLHDGGLARAWAVRHARKAMEKLKQE
jgi:hypothetical protein